MLADLTNLVSAELPLTTNPNPMLIVLCNSRTCLRLLMSTVKPGYLTHMVGDALDPTLNSSLRKVALGILPC